MAEDSKCRSLDVAGGMTRFVRSHAPWRFLTAFVVSVLTIPWRVASPQCPPLFGQKCLFGPDGSRVGVAGVGLLVGENEGLGGLVLHVVAPVRLHEHGVDLLEIDGLGLVADGFDKSTGAEVPDGAQDAFGEAQDEVERVVGEGVVRQAGEVELCVDVGLEGVGPSKGVRWGERKFLPSARKAHNSFRRAECASMLKSSAHQIYVWSSDETNALNHDKGKAIYHPFPFSTGSSNRPLQT
ncbi:MAG: hypothetical protein WCP35_05655 [Verrucomicrobiota bacterium]